MNKMQVKAEPGKHDIVITREFDVPRALVYKAYTDPALVPQWWGPDKTSTEVEALEAKPGGIWRYVHRTEDSVFVFHGVFHSVIAPERLVNTIELDAAPGDVGLVVLTLEALEGDRTRLTEWSIYPTIESRDGIIASGMEYGAADSFDRLETLARTLAQAATADA